MKYELGFTDMLPVINTSDNFIITQEAHKTFAEDWLAYISKLVDIAFDEKKDKFKSIKDAVKTKKSFFSMSEKARNLLGIGPKFAVIDLDVLDGEMKIKPLMGYSELVEIYFSREVHKVHGAVTRAIIDRFFGYQWSNHKLLYPINNRPLKYQRPEDWQEMIDKSELSSMLNVWFTQKGKVSITVNYRKAAINSVLASTRWHMATQISDSELSLLQESISGPDSIRTNEFEVLVINELRYMLIDSGRDDIRKPRDISKEKRGSNYDDDGYIVKKFEWVDTVKYPNLKVIKEFGDGYIERLSIEGLAISTIMGKVSSVNNFIRYLMLFYPFAVITVDVVDSMFEPKNKESIFNHLQGVRSSRSSASGEMNEWVAFLVHSELYSSKARKNTPVNRTTVKMQPYRNAMPKAYVEMNPEDAAEKGINNGDLVKLTTARGEILLPAWVNGRGRPPRGSVFVPFFDETKLINHLTLDSYCPVSKEPDYKKCATKIEKYDPKEKKQLP